MALEFVDTNVLVYAHDRTAGKKRAAAMTILESLDASGQGSLSIQVLQEFAVTSMTKVKPPLPSAEVIEIVEDLSDWTVYSPGSEDVLEALRLMGRFTLSFWDAMVVRASLQVEAAVLWTEDLNDGQDYGGVVARNPFKEKD